MQSSGIPRQLSISSRFSSLSLQATTSSALHTLPTIHPPASDAQPALPHTQTGTSSMQGLGSHPGVGPNKPETANALGERFSLMSMHPPDGVIPPISKLGRSKTQRSITRARSNAMSSPRKLARTESGPLDVLRGPKIDWTQSDRSFTRVKSAGTLRFPTLPEHVRHISSGSSTHQMMDEERWPSWDYVPRFSEEAFADPSQPGPSSGRVRCARPRPRNGCVGDWEEEYVDDL